MSVALFKVGDEVKVTNKGAIYTTYEEVGKRYPSWKYDEIPKRLTKYTVIGVHEHCGWLYAIQNASGQVYLYKEGGLDLVSPPAPAPKMVVAPFDPESWMEVNGYKDEQNRGQVIDRRVRGNSHPAACWLSSEGSKEGIVWQANQAFRKLQPLDAAAMLLKLSDVQTGV